MSRPSQAGHAQVCHEVERLRRRLRATLLILVVVLVFPCLCWAGEVVVSQVSGKHRLPSVEMPAYLKDELIRMHGEEMGRQLYEQMAAGYALKQKEPYYQVLVDNTDLLRRAVRVELLLEFFGPSNVKTGHRVMVMDDAIEPDSRSSVQVFCTDDVCRNSERMSAKVHRVEFVELRYGKADEIVFEWDERRWYLEDRWATEKRFILRSFSRDYYTRTSFDDRVFPPGGLRADETRYYRMAREGTAAGYGQGSVEREVEHYELLPGFVVEKGKRREASFFSWGDVGITDTGVSGTIAAGDFVQIKAVEIRSDGCIVVIAPVCAKAPGHRRLRARIRFVLGKEMMKGPDEDGIDQAVREWLQPVSVGQVSKVCGPIRGIPVTGWDAQTTAGDVENMLGPPALRRVTPSGEVLVYGRMEILFIGGNLAGVEKKGN